MILISGATGHLGKSTVDFLLKKTSTANVAVLARDKGKASIFEKKGLEVRQGDYADYDSLLRAFRGVDTLFFISGSDVVNRLQHHANVVNAAKEADVKHVVYTSFQRKNETEKSPIALVAKSHIDTEGMLKDSGITYTLLKHNLYMEMVPLFIGEKVLETGTIFLPAGNGQVSYASRIDMAEAAANILTTAGHENKTYEIAGTVSHSYHDIASIIGELTGKTITYVSPTQDSFQQELTKAGVPAEYIGLFASFGEAIKQGEFDFPDPTLENLLGRKPVSMKEFLKQVYVPVSEVA